MFIVDRVAVKQIGVYVFALLCVNLCNEVNADNSGLTLSNAELNNCIPRHIQDSAEQQNEQHSTEAVKISPSCEQSPPFMLGAPLANVSGTTITVSWTNAREASSYVIRQAVNGSWQAAQSVVGLSKQFAGTAGNTYQYQVAACNDWGCSGYSFSNSVSLTASEPAPATPALPTVGLSGTTINTSWAAVSGATSYRIQQRVNSGSWQAELNKGTTRSHAFSGSAGNSYQYRLRACNSSSCSAWSAISGSVSILSVPAVPAKPVATLTTVNGISVSWAGGGVIEPPPCQITGTCHCSDGQPCIPLSVGETPVTAITESEGAYQTADVGIQSTGTVSYRIQQRLNGGSWQTEINAGTATSRAFTGLAAGSYQYQVRACNANNQCSAYTAISNSISVQAIPAAPAKPSASINATTITASWIAVSGATSYRVQQRLNSGSWQSEINTGATVSRAFAGLAVGSYQYQVRACNANNQCSAYSPVSNTVSILSVPAVPAKPVATLTTVNGITVNWAAGGGIEPPPCQITGTCHCSDGQPCIPLGGGDVPIAIIKEEDGAVDSGAIQADAGVQSTGTVSYRIQQRLNGGSWQAEINAGTATSRAFTGLAAGSYQYQVRACNANNQCSAYTAISNIISVQALPGVPAAPTVSFNGTSLSATWLPVSGATSYRVQQRINSGNWSGDIYASNTGYNTTGTAGSSYQYQVKACNANNYCSAFSAASTQVSLLPVPASPTGLSASLDGTTINTSWNIATHATIYHIRQSLNGTWQSEINKGTTRAHAFSATPGANHQYQVRACSSSGCSAWSIATPVITLPPLPALPANPTARLSGNNIVVSWVGIPPVEPCEVTGTCHCRENEPCIPLSVPTPETLQLKEDDGLAATQSSATTYRLQGYKDGVAWGSEIANIGATSTNIPWAQAGSYTFKVRACNSSGCSAYTALSNAVSISQVAAPAATPNGGSHSGQVNVTLSTATSGATIRYTVNNTAVTASSAQYTAAIPLNQSATIRAKAFKTGMAESGELVKSFSIVPVVPSKPLASISGSMINVVWDDVAGASGYQIQYKTATTEWNAFVTSNNGSGHSYASLALGKYQFRVKACNPLPSNCSAVSVASDEINLSGGLPAADPDSIPSAHSQSVVADATVIGGTTGAFRVDESGAVTYSIPLQLPAGIAGNTPELSLNYHSQAGNGPVGIGWSVGGLSSIERCRQTPIQDGEFKAIALTNTDRFCLDGQRLAVISGNYGAAGSVYATEIDSQVKVTALGNLYGGPEYFEVRRADGSISYYGSTEDSRFTAISGPAISWAISEVTDLIGSTSNVIRYQYRHEGEEQLIHSVSYSGNEVIFGYDLTPRIDRASLATFDKIITPSALLEDITVKNHSLTTVYQMTLTHGLSPLSNVYRVETITECAVSNKCMKPLNIDWYESAETSAGFKTSAAAGATLNREEQIVLSQAADMNGDGIMDWVYVNKKNNTFYVYVKQGTGYSLLADSLYKSFYFNGSELPEFRLIDINGDGKSDLLYYTNQWYLCTERQSSCSALNITTRDIALHDFDGNGLVDILTSDLMLFANTRTGFSAPQTVIFDTGISSGCGSTGFGGFVCVKNSREIESSISYDVNGDGINDLVVEILDRFREDNKTQEYKYWGIFIAERTSAGSLKFNLIDDLGYRRSGVNTAKGLQIGDLNGDGISDFLFYETNSVPHRWRIEFNSQNQLKQNVTVLNETIPSPDNLRFMQLADVTGNGINDIVYYNNGWRMVSYPFTGAPKAITGPAVNTSSTMQLADMRGKAKPAMAVTNFADNYIRWYDFGSITSEPPCNPDCTPPCNPVSGTCNNIQSMNYQSHSVGGHSGVVDGRQDKVKSFVSGHGLSTVIDYSFLTDNSVYTKGIAVTSPVTAPIYNLVGAIAVVSQVTSDTAQGTVSVAYQYEAGRIQAGGRGMLGFEKLVSTDLQSGIKTTTKYLQKYPYIGMPVYTKQEYNGKVISLSKNMYQQLSLNNNKTVYPYLHRSAEDKYVVGYNGTYGNPVFVATVTSENTYSSVEDRYASLDSVTVASYEAGAGMVRTVQTVNDYYHDDISKWLLNRVSRSEVSHLQGMGSLMAMDACVICTEPGGDFTITINMSIDPAASVSRAASFDYYPSGLLKEEITEPEGDEQSYLKTSYTYDAVGNLKTSTLSSKAGASDQFNINRISENVYDAAGRYIISKKANGQPVANYSSFTALGQPQLVSENGVSTVLRYNAFGQPVFSREQTPGGTVSGRYSIITRGYTPSAVGLPSVGVSGYSYERVQQGGTPTQWKVADAAGRELATITEAFESGQYVVRQTQYDAMGRPVKVSQPAFDAANPVWNSSEYDVFSRPVLMVAADGTRTDVSYSGLSVTSAVSSFWSGAAAQSKTETKDAFGQLRSVTDAAGTMTYQYDATGNLLSVTGVDGQAMVMTYNGRGHKQTMADPDSGSWSYKYNALGELVEQTNPKNHITVTWYDNFGRKVEENILHGSATLRDTQWGYSDEAGHTVRNLVASEVVSGGAARYFDYDNLGRLTSSALHIEGEVLTESTTYDQYSRVFQVFDASGNSFGTQYQYQNGYSKAVWEARYGIDKANSVRYQNIIAMDAFGNVTESKAGNNRITWREHDDTTGMLKAITTQGGLQAWDYEFDGIGNLRSRSDQTHKLPALSGGSPVAFNESFEYDSLNRLEQVKNNGTVTQSLSYFANGNIKTKSDVQNGATYQYGTKPGQCGRNSGPRAVSQIGTTSYCYDVSGQQTHQYNNGTLVRQIDYDAIGKPSRIRSMGTDATTNSSPGDSFFTYDGSRNVIKRHVTEQGSTKTIYQQGGVELIKEGSSTTIRRNLGNAIVEVSGNTATTRYVYSDHLGSVDVITNAAGLIEQKLSFDTFGKRRQVFNLSNQPVALTLAAILKLTNRGFTGHLQVDHANVIHMGGRIYDAHIGRFLQADPFVQAPSNSQSHNRYSYVLNNPLSYTDPSGYFFKSLKKYWRVIAAAVISVITYGAATGWAAGWLAGTAFAGSQIAIGAIAGGIAGFVGGAVGSGSLKGALQGAFSGALFGGIGGSFKAYGIESVGIQMGAHALAGGVLADLQGGKFGHGFLTAGVMKGFGKISFGDMNITGRTIIQATVGGTLSKVTGGKFANGAITSAIQFVVNEKSGYIQKAWNEMKSTGRELKAFFHASELAAGPAVGAGVNVKSPTGTTINAQAKLSVGINFTDNPAEQGFYLKGDLALETNVPGAQVSFGSISTEGFFLPEKGYSYLNPVEMSGPSAALYNIQLPISNTFEASVTFAPIHVSYKFDWNKFERLRNGE